MCLKHNHTARHITRQHARVGLVDLVQPVALGHQLLQLELARLVEVQISRWKSRAGLIEP